MEWKEIIGFNGRYFISETGLVKSITATTKKILKTHFTYDGYEFCTICLNTYRKTIKIHRLVAMHFLPPVSGKTHVNHKDGNKKNNHVANLEWVTPSENISHAIRIGIKAKPPKKISKQLLIN